VIDCGLLNRRESLLWAHWWNVRGHHASLHWYGRGLYRCILHVTKRYQNRHISFKIDAASGQPSFTAEEHDKIVELLAKAQIL
jgi:hypothetical protein